MKYPKMPQ